MRKRKGSKLLSLLLSLVMVVSMLPVSIWAEDSASATWTKAELADITENDTVAITMTKDGTTWVLPTTGAGSKGQPLAVAAAVEGDTLTTAGAAADAGWTLAQSDAGFSISCANGNLYLTADNNGVRIGSTEAAWSVADEHLTAADTDGTTRYLGVYDGQDWRCYKSINNNIAGQAVGFWKLSGETAPTEPEEPAEPTVLNKLTAAPADGSTLAIYHPASGMAMTGTASGSKLAGTAVTRRTTSWSPPRTWPL